MTRDMSRQSFLGADSDTVLSRVKVGVVGLGGGGSQEVQQIAHVGVMNFCLPDPDVAESSNLNRLVGATLEDVILRREKTEIAERLIIGLNPSAHIERISDRWQVRLELLRDCVVILGCVDSFSEREELERFCRRFLIPYIDIGMDVIPSREGFRIVGQVVLSSPGAPCLRCMGVVTDENLKREAEHYGMAGARPQVVWPNGVLASTAVGLFVQLVTPWHDSPVATAYFEYNGNDFTLSVSPRLSHLPRECPHFKTECVGDPLFRLDRLAA